jgi:hypothetical protein
MVAGTRVTVAGVGFIGQQNTRIKCKFGDVESNVQTTRVAESVVFLTQTSIMCVAPPQLMGNVRIQVSLNGLDGDYTRPELGALYIYHQYPELSGVPKPSAGPAVGGTMITVTGSGFRPGEPRCKFWTSAAEGGLNSVTTVCWHHESVDAYPLNGTHASFYATCIYNNANHVHYLWFECHH